jgi:phage terminase large subunit
MIFTTTTALKKIAKMQKRIRAVSGGSSASKTISILMWLIDYAQNHKNEVVSVVSESMPHLRRGAMRDFLAILKAQNMFVEKQWNATNCIYMFKETGTIMEFFGVEESDKVHGPRRDVLFVNEANNIPLETYTQLEIRTRRIVWLDWNPVAEFWWYTDVAAYTDHDFLTLTYKDNEALSLGEIEAFEQHSKNPSKANWWKVYGLGMLGEATGLIFKGWEIIPDLPSEARLEDSGLDFGYTNDPSAAVYIYYYNGGYILDELFYQKGMSNRVIADNYLASHPTLVIADSAEPKSIDEINGYFQNTGFTILGTLKGPGSVAQGIQFVQDQHISVTARSLNIIKEYRNYLWAVDPRTGKSLNDPVGINDHAMSAVRYGLSRKFIDMDPQPEYNVPDSEKLQEMGINNQWGGIEGYAGIPFGLQR